MVPKPSWIKVPFYVLDNFHGLAKFGEEGGTRLKRGCGELENIVFLFLLPCFSKARENYLYGRFA